MQNLDLKWLREKMPVFAQMERDTELRKACEKGYRQMREEAQCKSSLIH